MRAALWRNILISLLVLLFVGITLMAHSYSATRAAGSVVCTPLSVDAPSDMPWEVIASQLLGSVSL